MMTARKILLIAVAAATAMAVGCGAAPGAVEGYVYSSLAGSSPFLITGLEATPEGYTPASGIRVGIEGTCLTTRTDPMGHFVLDGIRPGRKRLTATGASGGIGHRMVSVIPGEKRALAPVAPSAPAEWTILIYIAADNNLDYEGNADINEMEEVALPGDIQVVAQFDGAFSGDSRRIQVIDQARGGSAVIEDMGEVDMSSGKELQDFVEFGLTCFPAERVMLVLWNHGGGVWPRSITRPFSPQGVAWDDTTGVGPWDCLTTDEIRISLEEALSYSGRPKLDIINFDACLMQMHEVAVELAGLADFMVGSEESTPLNGNPYDEILGVLANDPATGALELSSAIVGKFCASYPGPNYVPVLQSAVRIRGPEWDAYLNAVDAFSAALMDLDYAGLQWIRDNHIGASIQTPDVWCEYLPPVPVPRFSYAENADLGVFMDRLAEDDESPVEIADSARAVRAALSEIIVASGAATYEAALPAYGGISILLPRGLLDWQYYRDPNQYARLRVAQTKWYQAIRAIMPPLGSVGGFQFRVSWSGGEIDLFVVEPHGGVYGVGSSDSSPNGSFSPDMVSFSTDQAVAEYYQSDSAHELGRYRFFIRCGAAYGPNPVHFTVEWKLAGKTIQIQDELAEGTYVVYSWSVTGPLTDSEPRPIPVWMNN